MTSARGFNQAMRLIEPYVGKVPVFLWGSLPCTLGSPWQKLNCKKPGWAARSDYLAKQFIALHKNFMKLATHISKHKDGHVCYEWPRRCSLWRDPRVLRMIKTFKMAMVNIDGCMLGLESSKHNPIMKPWTLRSTFPELV